ncbi:MAG: hypothetical protein K6F14_02565 [Clostridiales bacterium]|nr:hypothetical protein [Clostridiales bacterium]
MRVLKAIIGCMLFPFKLLCELFDPILRYIEMFINIPISFVLGGIVNLINMLPSIGIIHIGELILGLLSGGVFFVLNYFVLHLNVNIYLIFIICTGISIIGYFISYLLFKFVINFISSVISFIIVFIRVAIYLPGSIWMTLIKTIVPTGIWCLVFFFNYEYWISSTQTITYSILLLFALLTISSIITLIIRRDVKFSSLGTLGNVSLEELSSFTHSIGLYIMTCRGVPVYIGRAIEFNNGGLRKRIRDYQRGANTHSSGKWIQEHQDDLKLYIIELGHTGEDVDFVKDSEETMISRIYTKLNKVDAGISYVINISGYVIGGIAFCIVMIIILGVTNLLYVLIPYSLIVSVVCIVLYLVENKNKWR